MAGGQRYCRCKKCFGKKNLLSKTTCNEHLAKFGRVSLSEIEEHWGERGQSESQDKATLKAPNKSGDSSFSRHCPPDQSQHTATSQGNEPSPELDRISKRLRTCSESRETSQTELDSERAGGVDRSCSGSEGQVDACDPTFPTQQCSAEDPPLPDEGELEASDDRSSNWPDAEASFEEDNVSPGNEAASCDDGGYESDDSDIWESGGKVPIN